MINVKQACHCQVSGCDITYVWSGYAFCGDCIAEAVSGTRLDDWNDGEHREVSQGITYADKELGECPVHCDSCNKEISNY